MRNRPGRDLCDLPAIVQPLQLPPPSRQVPQVSFLIQLCPKAEEVRDVEGFIGPC